jgi:hypothetical protein
VTPAATAAVAWSAAASPDLTTIVRAASENLRLLAASLPFYDTSSRSPIATRVANHVPVAALTAAATILEDNPGQYPAFDSTIRSAADYVTTMAPLVVQLEQLHRRLSKSVSQRHAQGANEALALLQTLRGVARSTNARGALLAQESLGKQLVGTRGRKRATTVTQQDLKGAAKTIKLSKVHAEAAAEASVINAKVQTAAANLAVATGATDASSQAPPPSPNAGASTAPAGANAPASSTNR